MRRWRINLRTTVHIAIATAKSKRTGGHLISDGAPPTPPAASRALTVHAHGDVADAGPRVQPGAKCPAGPAIRRQGAPSESHSRTQELAALVEHGYSMTSSACSSNDGGIVSPSALAVFRLMVVTYFVGACTGSSVGLAPRKMRSTYDAACRD